MTSQQQCDYGRWPETGFEQQYWKGPDRLVHQMLTVYRQQSTLKKGRLWDPDSVGDCCRYC